MFTAGQRRLARQLYESGQALFEQGLYSDALLELQEAEKTFRELDVRGQPFSHPLSNGVSGLANSLALAGRCHQKLGDYRAAITCYETSLINRKFEKKPFRRFLHLVYEDLTFCYEQILNARGGGSREQLLSSDPELDISFRFPFSLPPDVVPLARLYELSPDRYGQYRAFYKRVRQRDAESRRRSNTEDGRTVQRIGIFVWAVLAAVWAAYAVMVFKALIDH